MQRRMQELADEIVRLQGEIHDPSQRYYQFLEHGDADGYRARLAAFREQLRTTKP